MYINFMFNVVFKINKSIITNLNMPNEQLLILLNKYSHLELK